MEGVGQEQEGCRPSDNAIDLSVGSNTAHSCRICLVSCRRPSQDSAGMPMMGGELDRPKLRSEFRQNFKIVCGGLCVFWRMRYFVV
ncbi:hypothetical protein GWI33_000028 [Rhynchophorus ferrugineus]|uniref:Uncharacterized protein n=1 Tax=Rhynchophorus ferrugineus TaxID=354439 RepID=A0A834J3R2_RHYFE|nr:hypothetical protein GWI33_000028 [Rhynchophorus ferrugineus]